MSSHLPETRKEKGGEREESRVTMMRYNGKKYEMKDNGKGKGKPESDKRRERIKITWERKEKRQKIKRKIYKWGKTTCKNERKKEIGK